MSGQIYRRRLPHWLPDGKAIHLVFRLAGSKPQPKANILLKNPAPKTPIKGPAWLADPRIAEVVINHLIHGPNVREWYQLYAFVIMPNHVHILLTPQVELKKITQRLKGRTARACNRILDRTEAFWYQESYDHWIRSYDELEDTAKYIENNPVRAGLVQSADEWKWSSASGCCAAGQTTKTGANAN